MKNPIVKFIAFVCLGFPTFGLALTLDEMAQQFPDTRHAFANLAHGTTHYEDRGDPQAGGVVLVHGVSGPLLVWDKVIGDMIADKQRVLRYDLFGRGYSARFDGEENYTLDTYVAQLEELLAERQVSKSITLVGSSFGAVISSEYALRHPERVQHLVLVGPAGFPIETPFLARLRDVPIVGDILFAVAGKSQIEQQNRKYFANLSPPEEFWDRFAAQLSVKGTAEAMRATMRRAPVTDYVESYKKLGVLGIPVDIIWGREDRTFPYKNHEILQAAIPKARLITVENAAHVPQYERPNEFMAAFREFSRDFR